MTILIEFDNTPLLFKSPVDTIECYRLDQVENCLDITDKWRREGFFCAGFVSYEAGYAFEKNLETDKSFDFPLISMGCYKKAVHLNNGARKRYGSGSAENINIDPPKNIYDRNIENIRELIAAGEIYQMTYCIKMHFGFRGDPFQLYSELSSNQPVPYRAYIETLGHAILSLSPEMFFKKKGSFLTTKPMKGTWPRGQDHLSDILARVKFSRDGKNRAENLMITDLLRNDIGKIGVNIKVPKLFEISRYKTLYQMTSTVTGTIDAETTVSEIFRALFPSGSVTGAPKLTAMRAIRKFETNDRRIYTGAIGYITPDNDMFFNVPIRTLLIRGGQGEMGIGGGIVWDSTPDGEWAESMLKAEFLTNTA